MVASAQLLGTDAQNMFLQRAKADPENTFKSWADGFKKVYQTVEEYERRLTIWQENLEFVLSHNELGKSYTLGMNIFSDWTYDEFATHALGYNSSMREPRLTSGSFRYEDTNAPQAVDWRKQGAVTEVKNQAQCGSCWAFSAVGAIEGANAIVSGELLSLSEQELIDCDRVHDQGCHGGLMDYAFEFVIKNGGLDTEDDYPYKGNDNTCNKPRLNRKVVTIDGYEDVPANSERALKKAVANQPVAIAIEADGRTFQLYNGGVYDDDTCGTQLNHGVLIVGYSEEGTKPYWVVKNSWGPHWGDGGYINMKMYGGSGDSGEGLCGLAMVASYPVKSNPNPPMPGPPAPEPKPTPPGPEPVQCDDTAECPAGSTCCCASEIFGMCLMWGCCPMPKATCCEDNVHCCPSTLPVCDVHAGRCMAGSAVGNTTFSVEWSAKQPAKRTSWFPHSWPWKRSEVGREGVIAVAEEQ